MPSSGVERADWKNHPVIVALISGAAVAVFMWTVVFPAANAVQTAELARKKEQLTAASKKYTRAAEKLAETSASLREASRNLREHEKQFRLLAASHLFDDQNPWPWGFRKVGFQATESEVLSAYGKAAKVHEGGWIDVASKADPFSEATFYMDDARKVKYVSFDNFGHREVKFSDGSAVDSPVDNSDLIFEKLTETFGKPDLIKRRKTGVVNACWLGRRSTDIQFSGTRTMIFPMFEYVLAGCGTEDEVDAARNQILACLLPTDKKAEILEPKK